MVTATFGTGAAQIAADLRFLVFWMALTYSVELVPDTRMLIVESIAAAWARMG